MQLLGLYLYEMPKAVSKVLQKGWYPLEHIKAQRQVSLSLLKTQFRIGCISKKDFHKCL